MLHAILAVSRSRRTSQLTSIYSLTRLRERAHLGLQVRHDDGGERVTASIQQRPLLPVVGGRNGRICGKVGLPSPSIVRTDSHGC